MAFTGRQRINPLRRILLILGLGIFALGLAPHLQAAETVWEEQVLQVQINGSTIDEMLVVLRDDAGGYWFEAGDFARLRLVLPSLPPHEQGGHPFYPLSAIVGAQVNLDVAQALLQVHCPPSAFIAQALTASTSPENHRIESGTGLFANYDLYALNSRGEVGGSAYGEVGLFSGFGVLTSSSVMRHAVRSTGHVRLDTTFTRDFRTSCRRSAWGMP